MTSFQEYHRLRSEGFWGPPSNSSPLGRRQERQARIAAMLPASQPGYKPGLRPDLGVGKAATERGPITDFDDWKTRQPGLLPRQHGGDFAGQDPDTNDDVVSTWDVVYRNLVDQDPNLADDKRLKKAVYDRIADIARRNGIHDPKEVMNILSKDPELSDYISRVSRQQRGGFERRARGQMGSQPASLRVFKGEEPPNRNASRWRTV